MHSLELEISSPWEWTVSDLRISFGKNCGGDHGREEHPVSRASSHKGRFSKDCKMTYQASNGWRTISRHSAALSGGTRR
jgi:hypothetical protein